MITSYTQTCGFCGCVCSVEVTLAFSQPQALEYHCPECDKPSLVRTNQAPRVTLLEQRTDGRQARYPMPAEQAC